MLKTTTKLLSASVALALWLAPSVGAAGVHSVALEMLMGAATLGDNGQAVNKQADALLHEARQAMSEGHYDVADEKISRAEALHPRYPLFHSGDTPKKARADLTKISTQQKKSAGGSRDPFANRAVAGNTATERPQGSLSEPKTESTSAPTSATEQAADMPQSSRRMQFATKNETNPWSVDSKNAPEMPAQPTLPTAGRMLQAPDSSSAAMSSRREQNPAETSSDLRVMANQAEARAHSDALLLDARRALASRDMQTASMMLEQAKGLGVRYSPLDDSPDKIEALIRKQGELQTFAGPPAEASQRQAELLMEQAEGMMRWRDLDSAQRLAAEAQRLPASYGPSQQQPAQLLERISNARQGVGPDAPMVVRVGEDRPQAVILDPTAQAQTPPGVEAPRQGMVIPANAEFEITEGPASTAPQNGPMPATGPSALNAQRGTATRAVYNPAIDSSRNMPAAAAEVAPQLQPPHRAAPPRLIHAPAPGPSDAMPSPDNGTGEGIRWFRKGLDAIASGRSDEALKAFRRSYAFQTELDPVTRQQLIDHLEILGEPVEKPAETETPPLIPPSSEEQPATQPASNAGAAAEPAKGENTASAASFESSGLTGQALARQVAAEVARQQTLAKQMREKQPKQALELLERTRKMVGSVDTLDPGARDQLVRRLDLSITELKQYISQNGPQIELEERNRQVQDEVDRRRNQKVQVEEKLAYLVDDFNKLVDEQRYAEAQVMAKRAMELDPDNPVVVQLGIMSKQLQRVAEQNQIWDDKEQGYYAAMTDVDKSSTPFVGPIEFPDVKTWDRLTKSRSRMKSEGALRRSPKELEIEKRLSTPVALKFQQRPLSEVITYLGKVAEVPVYLDPEGLRAEGVSSDTPVTIDLSQDISLKSALKLILEPLRLAYIIKDEVLKITSEDMQRGQLYAVTYPVADLVIPIPNFVPDGREGINAALREAYSRMGFSGAAGGGFANSGPLAVLASEKGGGTSNAAINPALLAQMHAIGVPIGGGGPPQTGTPQGNPFGPGGMGGGAQADFDTLIELIRSTVGPPTIWDDMGGQGTIEGFETNLSLVVYQTQEKHEEIADLLAQLRRQQDLQVTIEVRFITLNDAFFERIGVDFDFDLTNTPKDVTQNAAGGTTIPFSINNPGPSAVVGNNPQGNLTNNNDIQFRQGSFADAVPPAFPGLGFDPATAATFGFAILSDIEAFFLIEAAQGDTRTNVLQAPKLTLFNGQLASVSDVTQRPFVTQIIPVVGDFAAAQQPVIVVLSEGTSLTVQAVVSNDRRFVRLTVVPFFSNIGDVDTFTFTGTKTTISSSSDSKKGTDESASSKGSTDITEGTTVQLPTFSFVAVSTTVNVPDGGTVLLGGVKRLSEGRNEFGVPILSKVPYINRLFRNVGIGRTTNSLMMMVTPRIIIQEEEEENLLGTAPP